jgi:hypothetical protein
MSSIDTNLLDALRKLGVVIPDAKPLQVNRRALEQTNWHVTIGQFDCMVDTRDASTAEEALRFATTRSCLQPWYYTSDSLQNGEQATVVSATHNDFVDWIRRGEL